MKASVKMKWQRSHRDKHAQTEIGRFYTQRAISRPLRRILCVLSYQLTTISYPFSHFGLRCHVHHVMWEDRDDRWPALERSFSFYCDEQLALRIPTGEIHLMIFGTLFILVVLILRRGLFEPIEKLFKSFSR